MSWESATVLGSLGVCFYFLYLSKNLGDRHELLQTFLMLISWLSLGIPLSHIHSLIQVSAAGATSNISIASLFYQVWVWVSMGYVAYWFLWLFYTYGYKKLWLKVGR